MITRHTNILAFLSVLIAGYLIAIFTIGWNSSLLKGGDQWGYNSYLVSVIINKDIKKLDKTYEAARAQYRLPSNAGNVSNRIDEAPDAPNGNRVLKYFYGVAALQAPFFLVTHLFVQGSGYEAPYVWAIYISTLFYVVLGAFILFQLLKQWVSQRIAMLAILIVFFCTNLFYFTIANPGLSQPYLFFLFSCLLYCVIHFYRSPNNKSAILIGCIMGLVAATRITEIIIVFIPLLFAPAFSSQEITRMTFIKQHFKKILLALFFFVLFLVPQLLYWKMVTGHWFYDTYPGEGFDFLHPHIMDGLCSFKNGWFAYTPVMILPLLCLPFLFKAKNPFGTGIMVYILFDIYITYSWKEWNYNAGLGSRPMVESYALLVIPLALGLKQIMQHTVWRYVTGIFLLACLYLNILRTVQMQTGNFISEDASWQFNRQMLFKLQTNNNDVLAFDLNEPQPDTKALRLVKKLGAQNFESASEHAKDTGYKISGRQSAYFNRQYEFNDIVEVKLDTSFAKGDFLRITAWARVASNENHYRMGKIVVQTESDGKLLMWKSVRIHNKLINGGSNNKPSLFNGAINKWVKFSFFVKIDHKLAGNDVLKIYGWNPLGAEFWIDDLMVEQFRQTIP